MRKKNTFDSLHLTPDRLHVTIDKQGVVIIVSLALAVWELGCSEDLEKKDQRLT